jgi:prolyl-tRNA editing enzyme YbaK/EbsC (Cys-tRNA(Pro) deacylase)
MHQNALAVIEAARSAGLEIEVRSFPEGTRTAEDAARAVGCDVGQIVKSLVFVVDDEPILAMVSGRNQLDETLLRTTAGGDSVRRANAEEVRNATGFAIGGVPPVGHSLRVFVDEDLLTYDEVWAAAGTPRDVFGVEPSALVAAVKGSVASLARAGREPS